MPIEGFDYKAFANDLASQAMEILKQQSSAAPSNLQDEEKQGIIDTINRFCLMSGEALSNDEQIKLNAQQASLITQFIGEWTFHKSIDLINSNIPVENREPILQVIAANIFNTAKLAIIKNLPQEQLISLVETKVKQVYDEELEKLVKRGIITQEQQNEAANKSNLNEMVQKTQEAKQQQEAQGDLQNAGSISANDTKSLKFIALAILLNHLDDEKVQIILGAFEEQDALTISNYMKMSGLEDKVDRVLMLKALEEIKRLIPLSDSLSISKALNRFHKELMTAPPKLLNKISLRERENVRDFILDVNFPALEVFPPLVLKSVISTLEKKINDN